MEIFLSSIERALSLLSESRTYSPFDRRFLGLIKPLISVEVSRQSVARQSWPELGGS